MATVTLTPGTLKGCLQVPPSKSVAHRAILAAALAKGESQLHNVELSRDIAATLRCVQALGAVTRYDGGCLTVDGTNTLTVPGDLMLDCGESGSTLRFLMPLSLLRSGEGQTCFTGHGRLLERPLAPYEPLFAFHRAQNCIVMEGSLTPGSFALRGDVSSQFVTGLLYALPLLGAPSEILLTTPLESAPYVDLTLSVLEAFGITVDGRFHVPGGQAYQPCVFTVEGDESQAAFWRVANALGSEVTLLGLRDDTRQGDRAIASLIARDVSVIDVREIPDLVPILAVWRCLCPGESQIVGAGRLRIKESDRLHAITTELRKLGADITEQEDALFIRGVTTLHGAEVECWNDHRIAMALAIAATRCDKPVTLHGAECVNKSYPTFFEHLDAVRRPS